MKLKKVTKAELEEFYPYSYNQECYLAHPEFGPSLVRLLETLSDRTAATIDALIKVTTPYL